MMTPRRFGAGTSGAPSASGGKIFSKVKTGIVECPLTRVGMPLEFPPREPFHGIAVMKSSNPSKRRRSNSITINPESEAFCLNCGLLHLILKSSGDVRGAFPDLRGTGNGRGAVRTAVRVSRRAEPAQPDRVRDPPRRPAAERICRAVGRAARLADRLYRLGRGCGRAL